jgi:hypothetical protein
MLKNHFDSTQRFNLNYNFIKNIYLIAESHNTNPQNTFVETLAWVDIIIIDVAIGDGSGVVRFHCAIRLKPLS